MKSVPKLCLTQLILLVTVLTSWNWYGFAQTNVSFLSNINQYSSAGYNDIWGYVDGTGNEFALLGVVTGTSIINVTNPTNPVEVVFIPGPISSWRDIKTHGTYAYIVTEGTGTGRGLQIVDLSQLPTTATLVNTLETWFTRAHNIYIDDGYAYVIGTNSGGGMHILDLTNPTNPTRTVYYTGSGYIHDVYVWDDTVVACAEDVYDLVNVTNKTVPQLISTSAALPGIYAHSGWMTQDNRYFIGCEEFNVRDITVWDLIDRSTWDLIVSSWQLPGSTSIVHNLFVKGNFAHISYYTSGYVVLDISDPTNPQLAGQYDTYPSSNGGTYNGAWGCYPYLPSGNTLISDIETGLYVLHFDGEVQTFPVSVTIANGWNMVSIPGLHPANQNVDTWWQYRDLGASVYKFGGSGYTDINTTIPGEGYWMKHNSARIYNTGDEWPVSGIQNVPHTPINAYVGWNLIGGYENVVATSGILTSPPGLISGPLYEYSSGYQAATNLVPGYGYWIKLTGAGQIIIPETFAKGEAPVEYFPENWGKIVLTDATGINYTLYAVKGEVNLDQYELPPAPMAEMFDIRFSSGRIAEDINSSMKTIDMSGVTYPVTVRAEGMDMRLMDETGTSINVNIKSGEVFVINDATIMKLVVSGVESIPAEFTLEQNYPNPFNPTTTISFSLPEAANVALRIYNTLGEKVAELVNSKLEAGRYSFQWDANNVATGIYINELRADNFISVKKMVYLK